MDAVCFLSSLRASITPGFIRSQLSVMMLDWRTTSSLRRRPTVVHFDWVSSPSSLLKFNFFSGEPWTDRNQ